MKLQFCIFSNEKGTFLSIWKSFLVTAPMLFVFSIAPLAGNLSKTPFSNNRTCIGHSCAPQDERKQHLSKSNIGSTDHPTGIANRVSPLPGFLGQTHLICFDCSTTIKKIKHLPQTNGREPSFVVGLSHPRTLKRPPLPLPRTATFFLFLHSSPSAMVEPFLLFIR